MKQDGHANTIVYHQMFAFINFLATHEIALFNGVLVLVDLLWQSMHMF